MKRTRLLAILFAALLTLSATACGSTQTTTQTETASTADTAVEAVTETEVTVALPDTKFDSAEVMFLTSENKGYDWYSSYDIYAAEMNGQLINDAVFTRNQMLEERLDVVIAETKREGAHQIARESLIAGDDQFHVVMPYINSTISLATEGLLTDLRTVEWMDLDKPWWDQRANNNMIIANKLFFSTGDISILDNECTMVMFFNKDMVAEYGLESPYDLVKNMGWTIDKVKEMAQVVTNDADGNGKLDKADVWGMTVASNAPISFYFGAGERIVVSDPEKELVLSIGNSRSYDVFEKVMDLCLDEKVIHADFNDAAPMFNEGRVLFTTFALVDINDLREAEFAFGILPYPMFDEAQGEYNNLISTGLVTTASIPYNCKDVTMTGAVLEAMAYYSMDTLTPAYYDNALKGRYVRDEESGDMLDIIFATRVYDLGFIFDWGGAGSLVTKRFQAKSTDFASAVEGIQTKAETALTEALENFAKLQ